ncbi:MAG: hypothetical protein Kow00109_20780 [Acidobacteriota bacterium]
MRHRWAGRKLGRTTSHRKALLRTMVTQLFEHEKIVTTVPKAKEVRSVAEKMVTLGKQGSLHSRRRALAFLRKKSVVHKLFAELGPRYQERAGGYTRIVRLGKFRPGDAAELALLELIDAPVTPSAKKEPAAEAPTLPVEEQAEAKAVPEAEEKGEEAAPAAGEEGTEAEKEKAEEKKNE